MSRIIWAPPEAHVAVWKNPPEVMLTSLNPRSLMEWAGKNAWADNIPLIVFTDDTPPRRLGFPPFYAFAPATGMAPHIVVNPPPDARLELGRVQAADLTPALSYVAAVAAVGRALLDKRVAWLQPESDHSIGACVLASTRGAQGLVVAISGRQMMDAIGARAAGHHNVNVQTLGTIKGTGIH